MVSSTSSDELRRQILDAAIPLAKQLRGDRSGDMGRSEEKLLQEALRDLEKLLQLPSESLHDMHCGLYIPEWEVKRVIEQLQVVTAIDINQIPRSVGQLPQNWPYRSISTWLSRQLASSIFDEQGGNVKLEELIANYGLHGCASHILKLGRGVMLYDCPKSLITTLQRYAEETERMDEHPNGEPMMEDQLTPDWPHIISQIRKEHKLSQDKLSRALKALGVKRAADSTISTWETGRVQPNREAQQALLGIWNGEKAIPDQFIPKQIELPSSSTPATTPSKSIDLTQVPGYGVSIVDPDSQVYWPVAVPDLTSSKSILDRCVGGAVEEVHRQVAEDIDILTNPDRLRQCILDAVMLHADEIVHEAHFHFMKSIQRLIRLEYPNLRQSHQSEPDENQVRAQG